jgi:hypothetical protein
MTSLRFAPFLFALSLTACDTPRANVPAGDADGAAGGAPTAGPAAAPGADAVAPSVELDADALPTLSALEEARIGSATDPDVGFAAIAYVDVDADGNVYAYESRDGQIRVHGPGGARLRVIGRRGQGPGEFSGMTAMGVAGDTLWVLEGFRIQLFRGDGTLISTARAEPFQAAGSGVVVRPLAMGDGGHFTSEVVSRAAAYGTETRVPRLRFDASGAVVDTVGWEPRVPQPPPTSHVATSPPQIAVDGVTYSVPRPPTDTPLWASLNDGSAVVERRRASADTGAEFTLTRFDLAGDTLYRHRFRYRPGRYEGALLDTMAMRPLMRSPRPSRAAFQAVRASLDYPIYQSPVYLVWATQDGSLWLRREDNATSVFRWIVVAPNGAVRGLLELPRSADPLWARGDTLWASVGDELGILWLVRYRID